jgi:transposase
VHQSVLRTWVNGFVADPQQSFPGHGQMKPEQAEIARLKREVTKLKAERDILKNHRGLSPPVGRETAKGYPRGGRERPSAFWWRMTPLKNMVHGLLRT